MSDLSELERFESTVKKLSGVLVKYIHYATEHRGYKSIPVAILDPVLNGILSSYSSQSMLESFVRHSYPYWDQIHQSQTDFARDHMKELFPLIPDNYIPALLNLWDNYLDKDQKNVLMKYLQAFVGISIKFIHFQRKPVMDQGRLIYLHEYMNTIWVRQTDCREKCSGCSRCGVEMKLQILQAINTWNITVPAPPRRA